MKTKLLALMLAMVLLVSFASCSVERERNDDDDEEPSVSQTADPTEEPTSEPTIKPTATPEKESVLQVKGTWNNDVYTNNFLGLSYTLPEGWQAATDEEILTMMGLGAELLGKEDQLEQSLESQQTIYDFYVVNFTTGSNINISFENLSKAIGGLFYSEREYADVVKQQLQALEGMAYTIGEYEEVSFMDKTFLKMSAMVEYSGVSLEQCYFVHKEGKYMCNIIVTRMLNDEQTVEQIMEAFTKA